jgi:CRP-like cAMP-binding protein
MDTPWGYERLPALRALRPNELPPFQELHALYHAGDSRKLRGRLAELCQPYLAQTQLFSGSVGLFGLRGLEQLSRACTPVVYNKDHVLIRERYRCSTVYLIIKGLVRLFCEQATSRRGIASVFVGFRGPGQLAGLETALSEATPWFTAQACEDLSLLEIDGAALREIPGDQVWLRRNIVKISTIRQYHDIEDRDLFLRLGAPVRVMLMFLLIAGALGDRFADQIDDPNDTAEKDPYGPDDLQPPYELPWLRRDDLAAWLHISSPMVDEALNAIGADSKRKGDPKYERNRAITITPAKPHYRITLVNLKPIRRALRNDLLK